MYIKIDGLNKPEEISAAKEYGANMFGLFFSKKHDDCIKQISSNAGIIPDYVGDSYLYSKDDGSGNHVKDSSLVGIFENDMPQDIITRIYNYNLNYVQLNGDETSTMIKNLRQTVIPDIAPEIGIIKKLVVKDKEDIAAWTEYKDTADLLILEIEAFKSGDYEKAANIINSYNGNIPFILDCTDTDNNIEKAKETRHTLFAGINITKKRQS